MKKLFLTDYIGLCNRLDALCLSFAIRAAHGHRVCLDWPETDALRVDGTVVERFGWLDRLGAIKLRGDATEALPGLGRYRRIVQRTAIAAAAVTDPHWPAVRNGLRLRANLWAEIQRMFAARAGRPVVGVHLRQGDFRLLGGDVYDAEAGKHVAVPVWWYEHVMARLVKRFPGVSFLLSSTGDAAVFAPLRERFDVFTVPCPTPYLYKGNDHQSAAHPVADLFALACCSVLIGTPGSTFTHFAANALGEPTVCLLPPMRTERPQPAVVRMESHGWRAMDWGRAWRAEQGTVPVKSDELLPAPGAPCLDWVQTWS